MIAFQAATVVTIKKERSGIQEAIVDIGDGRQQKAVCYTALVGVVKPGNRVIINTTAVDLGLGTGGYHFIVWNLNRLGYGAQGGIGLVIPEEENTGSTSDKSSMNATRTGGEGAPGGHIMKLRYTPLQLKCLAVEEEDSPHFEAMKNVDSIDGMPVVVGALHSQLPAAAATIKEMMPDARVAYIMTDGAAIPIAFSNLVAELKLAGLIDMTITIGHAFGGDLESINIYSGLAAAKHVVGADVAIVCMGPGIVGTGTKLGFTGIEQGQIINAVNSLDGLAFAIPRISFADKRERHYGLSHHTITALTLAAMSRATVALPEMETDKADRISGQIAESGIDTKHNIITVDADITLDALKKREIQPTTMGRGIDREPEFFKAAGAAAILAVNAIGNGGGR